MFYSKQGEYVRTSSQYNGFYPTFVQNKEYYLTELQHHGLEEGKLKV